MKLNLSGIFLPKKFLLYATGALAAGAIFMMVYFYLTPTPSPLKPTTLLREPVVPAADAAPTLSPQVVEVAAAPDKNQAAESSVSKGPVTPPISINDVQKGKEVFSLQERREKAELELTISRVENDIKKEKIRDQYMTKYPELALAGDAAIQLNKKADEQKKGGEHSLMDTAKASAEESLDKVRFLGIVDSRAVWNVGNGRLTTREGETVQGYLVTHVGPDKVTIIKNNRTVTYTP